MNKGEWNLNGTASIKWSLDLDGTLTKSDGGIIASVVKTFEELGRPVPDDAELHRFIGPAIIESLRRNHVPEDELDRAVTIYRSYYADRAVFDDPNRPGAEEFPAAW